MSFINNFSWVELRQKLMGYNIRRILLLAFLARLPFMFLEGASYDWWWYAQDASQFYRGKKPYVDYVVYEHNDITPGYLIVVTFIYSINKIFGLSVNSIFYNLSMKSWMVLGDILCVYLAYQICMAIDLGEVKSKIVSIILALNPYMIFESSYQGHFDSIVAASLLAGLYFAVKGRPYTSGLTLGIGALVKMIPAIGIILIFKFKRFSEKAKFLLGFFSLIVLIYTAFIAYIGSTSFILEPLKYHGSRTDYLNETNKTSTYFFLLYITNTFDKYGRYVDDIWLFFAIPILLYFTLRYYKKNDDKKEVYVGFFFILTGLIATMKFVNPQYLIWILPFMTIYIIMKPDKIRERAYWVLVFCFLLWAGTLIRWLKPVTGLIFLPALIGFFFTDLKEFYLKLRAHLIPEKIAAK